jgi:hypothetical protein
MSNNLSNNSAETKGEENGDTKVESNGKSETFISSIKKAKLALNTNTSQDFSQKVNMISNLSGEFFKVIMACLLAIFVPQSCNGEVCSFDQNFSDLNIYNAFVLAFNFLTLGSFLYTYSVEVKRENWIINHLDYDENESEYNIHKFKESHKKITTRLGEINLQYRKVYTILQYLYVCNFIFSAVLVFHFYYLDYRTITTLLTNIILCWSKISKGLELADKSVKSEIALSYYNFVNISFNTIDTDYLNKTNTEIVNQADKQVVSEVEVKDVEIKQVEIKEVEQIENKV